MEPTPKEHADAVAKRNKKVDHLKNEIKKMKINFDAVCTKNPNLWN